MLTYYPASNRLAADKVVYLRLRRHSQSPGTAKSHIELEKVQEARSCALTSSTVLDEDIAVLLIGSRLRHVHRHTCFWI
jgi:hypothetical protein